MKDFEVWYEEATIDNPYYCAFLRCGKYMLARIFSTEEAQCSNCDHCRRKVHIGFARRIKYYQILLGTINRPNVGERTQGCSVMRCFCGQGPCSTCPGRLDEEPPMCICTGNETVRRGC